MSHDLIRSGKSPTSIKYADQYYGGRMSMQCNPGRPEDSTQVTPSSFIKVEKNKNAFSLGVPKGFHCQLPSLLRGTDARWGVMLLGIGVWGCLLLFPSPNSRKVFGPAKNSVQICFLSIVGDCRHVQTDTKFFVL